MHLGYGGGLPADVVRDGGLCQNNQVSSVFDAVFDHTESLVDNAVVAFLAPLFPLPNTGLNHGDLRCMLSIASVEGSCFGGRQGDFSVNEQSQEDQNRECEWPLGF